jgi:hypothetical protein
MHLCVKQMFSDMTLWVMNNFYGCMRTLTGLAGSSGLGNYSSSERQLIYPPLILIDTMYPVVLTYSLQGWLACSGLEERMATKAPV